MKNRGLLIAIMVFSALLSTGIVYAAESNTFTFTGRVARTNFLNLELENVALSNPRPGELAEVADVNKKIIRLNLLLIEPGDSRTITFNILNSGNMAAKIGQMEITAPDVSTGVVVAWPSLENLIIAPGQSAGPFTVTVTWDISAQEALSGSVYFEAYIVYAQT